jgi:hypothetical protein
MVRWIVIVLGKLLKVIMNLKKHKPWIEAAIQNWFKKWRIKLTDPSRSMSHSPHIENCAPSLFIQATSNSPKMMSSMLG